jgi:hypothetical protein
MTSQERLARIAYSGYREFKMTDPLVGGRDGEFPEYDGLAPTEQLAWEAVGEALIRSMLISVGGS